jgi:hypothetical protein
MSNKPTYILYERPVNFLASRVYVKTAHSEKTTKLTGICTYCGMEARLGEGEKDRADAQHWVDLHAESHADDSPIDLLS